MASSIPHPTAAKVEADDPGLWSWVLAVLLWVECLVAVVAALRSGGGAVSQAVAFALYAAVLGGAAVARSGPLSGMRPATWLALAAVALTHVAAWILPLGGQPFRLGELLVYGAVLAVAALLTARERTLPPDRTLTGWARGFEVTARSVGLGFFSGVLLVIVDALVKLPFSGH